VQVGLFSSGLRDDSVQVRYGSEACAGDYRTQAGVGSVKSNPKMARLKQNETICWATHAFSDVDGCVLVWGRAPSLIEQKATDEQAAEMHRSKQVQPKSIDGPKVDDAAVMSKHCVPTAESMKITYRAFKSQTVTASSVRGHRPRDLTPSFVATRNG
jgi:hypothetical protein